MSWWKRIFGATDEFQVPPPNADSAATSDFSQLSSLCPEGDELDPLYEDAVNFVLESRRASISALQRKLMIGYNRAARMIELMEIHGIVSAMDSNGVREALGLGVFDLQAAAQARQAAIETAEKERVMRLNYLLDKYQDEETVQRIINKVIWDGMSAAQLFDALGEPAAIDQKYLKRVSREVWKYSREGKNRFASRVTLENGFVVGWDFKS